MQIGNQPYPFSATSIEGGGKVAVGTTAVEMTFTAKTKTIIITADFDNSGYIYIGKSTVTNAGANAMAILSAGDVATIDYDDVTYPLYCVASVAAQNVWKGALI